MDSTVAAFVIVALVVLATAIGVVVQRSNGRLKRAPEASSGPDDLELLGDGTPPGERATLILFSTEFCAKCPATRRMLDQIASDAFGVVVAEVDLTNRQDLASSYDIRQTPTVLMLDGAGQRVARIGGPPKRFELEAQLLQLSA